MPRTLPEIKAHLRAVIANNAISTTLIQTEDLEALCDIADSADEMAAVIRDLCPDPLPVRQRTSFEAAVFIYSK